MIPFALAMAYLYIEEKRLELRVDDLSTEGFSFRTAEAVPEKGCSLEVLFYHGAQNRYAHVLLKAPRINLFRKEAAGFGYRVDVEESEFAEEVRAFWKDYSRYVKLKTEESDGELSKALTGYPSEEDQLFPVDFQTQKLSWYTLAGRTAVEKPGAFTTGKMELAISLDRPALYQAYLAASIAGFTAEYWKAAGLKEHPLAQRQVTRLYVGNQFCHNLFPNREQLTAILEKAQREGIAVTLVTTYLREEWITEVREWFGEIRSFATDRNLQYEAVVNDWGMAALLRDMGCFTLSLGVLLNKRRKDPRMQYAKDYLTASGAVGGNNLEMSFYREFLQKKWGISSYEWETCGPAFSLPEGKHHLHLPFYQTNTSQYCTLAARCQAGNRGVQRLITGCPGYCAEYVYLYPEHLHMVGHGNSLFGYEKCALSDASYLEEYLEQGIDRVVINLL